MHGAVIRWGGSQTRKEIYDYRGCDSEYKFKTDEELQAFWIGVKAAIGWSEYEEVEEEGNE